MRAENLLLFGLMIVSLYKTRKRDEFRLFYYAIMGTFLILLVYEWKSRYIFSLPPLMLVMTGDGMEVIEDSIRKRELGNLRKCCDGTRRMI